MGRESFDDARHRCSCSVPEARPGLSLWNCRIARCSGASVIALTRNAERPPPLPLQVHVHFEGMTPSKLAAGSSTPTPTPLCHALKFGPDSAGERYRRPCSLSPANQGSPIGAYLACTPPRRGPRPLTPSRNFFLPRLPSCPLFFFLLLPSKAATTRSSSRTNSGPISHRTSSRKPKPRLFRPNYYYWSSRLDLSPI